MRTIKKAKLKIASVVFKRFLMISNTVLIVKILLLLLANDEFRVYLMTFKYCFILIYS